MTEKQRWLMRDLDAWREKQMVKIGRYGPRREQKAPATVRAAYAAARRAERVISKWNTSKKRPWEQQRNAVVKRVETVKRVILFENTATALRAVRGLK